MDDGLSAALADSVFGRVPILRINVRRYNKLMQFNKSFYARSLIFHRIKVKNNKITIYHHTKETKNRKNTNRPPIIRNDFIIKV